MVPHPVNTLPNERRWADPAQNSEESDGEEEENSGDDAVMGRRAVGIRALDAGAAGQQFAGSPWCAQTDVHAHRAPEVDGRRPNCLSVSVGCKSVSPHLCTRQKCSCSQTLEAAAEVKQLLLS